LPSDLNERPLETGRNAKSIPEGGEGGERVADRPSQPFNLFQGEQRIFYHKKTLTKGPAKKSART